MEAFELRGEKVVGVFRARGRRVGLGERGCVGVCCQDGGYNSMAREGVSGKDPGVCLGWVDAVGKE